MRADLRAGIVASTVASVMGKGKKTFAPMDFMPFYQTYERSAPGSGEALFYDDPEVQSRLIMATLFGVADVGPKDTYVIPD